MARSGCVRGGMVGLENLWENYMASRLVRFVAVGVYVKDCVLAHNNSLNQRCWCIKLDSRQYYIRCVSIWMRVTFPMLRSSLFAFCDLARKIETRRDSQVLRQEMNAE